MTAPIPPALVPEQWAQLRRGEPTSLGGFVSAVALPHEARMVLEGREVPGLLVDEDDLAPLIALANHLRSDDDAGKLTPLMVRQLREAAEWHRVYGVPATADVLDAIAGALAAVLPPTHA